MKSVLLSLFLLIAVAGTAGATERFALGDGGVAVKADHLSFTDFPDFAMQNGKDISDTYIGIETFGRIAPNLYLGGEIGYVKPTRIVYDDLVGPVNLTVTYIPVELNVKYGIVLGSNVALAIGAGVSTNYAKEEVRGVSITPTADDWLAGAQVSLDLNIVLDGFFIGANGKYQMTGDFAGSSYNYANWRAGGQFGFLF